MAKRFARKVLARADGMIAISGNTRADSGASGLSRNSSK